MNESFQSQSSIELSKIYETKTNEHKSMLDKLQTLLNNIIGLRNTIDSSFGDGTSSKIELLSNSILPDTIDPQMIIMDGDSKATLPVKCHFSHASKN